ncbi:MAG: manganese transporter [Cytophagales bacterium]|nr:MAG: manganese transporter [Cytophagales bacterium]
MKHFTLIKYICYLALVPFLLTQCRPTEDEKKKEKHYIVATTGMIGDVVKNIVQDRAEVVFLMGPGVDPHLYKATKSDLDKVRRADIVFFNGLHLEAKMADVLTKLAEKKPVYAIEASIAKDKLRMMDNDANSIDPHVWLDVEIWIGATQYIGEKLAQQDSTNADFYRKNTKIYIEKLQQLHQKIKTEISTIPKERRILITAHDALGYFGKAYDIEVKGLQGISTATEFGLKDITELVDFIVKKKIKAVFVETFISQKSLEAVVNGCKEKGHTVVIGGTLFTDALGSKGTPQDSYIGMLESNLKIITSALK